MIPLTTTPFFLQNEVWTYDCNSHTSCGIGHGLGERYWSGWGSNLDRASRTMVFWYSKNHVPSYDIFGTFGGDPAQP